jgi:homoserine acetyltransferase
MGGSDIPFLRYSTSEMAKDCLEVLDHLGWTEDRQLHVIGVSMGGMIAQELVRIPIPFYPFLSISFPTSLPHSVSNQTPNTTLLSIHPPSLPKPPT